MREVRTMNNMKNTNSNGLAKSDLEKARTNFSNKKNKMTSHDRPAIFIEDTKDPKQYNLSK